MLMRSPKSAEELSARFQKHFPKGRDLTLIILKSPLLAEERMNELLELSVPNQSSSTRPASESFSDCASSRRYEKTLSFMP